MEPHEWLTYVNRGPLPYTEQMMRGQVRCWLQAVRAWRLGANG